MQLAELDVPIIASLSSDLLTAMCSQSQFAQHAQQHTLADLAIKLAQRWLTLMREIEREAKATDQSRGATKQ